MQCLIYFVFITVTIKFCDANGNLFMKLSYFNNPHGKGANGEICEGKNIFQSLVKNECDHFFSICIGTPGRRARDCDLGRRETPHIKEKRTIQFGDMIGTMPNPLVFRRYRQNNFLLEIKVFDKDKFTSPDRVGAFYHYVKSIPVGTNGRRPKPLFQTLTSGNSDNILTFQFYLWAVCDKTYYGNDCSVKCIPQNSTTKGHYDCNQQTGEKICLEPYSGPQCLTIDFCASNPCKNNAKCINLANNFACSCPTGFNGRLCELVEQPCSRRRCKNSGTCFVEDNQPKCSCKRGFAGDHCEIDLDECYLAEPCQHNGTCVNLAGGFECICKPGFSGIRCEISPTGMPGSAEHSPEMANLLFPQSRKVGEKADWAYYIAGGAALVAVICITLLVTMYRRKRLLLTKERNAQAIVYRAAVQRPCAEENVYIGDNDSEGTLYEDIDRQLQDGSSEIDSCGEDPASDFANLSYGISSNADKEMK